MSEPAKSELDFLASALADRAEAVARECPDPVALAVDFEGHGMLRKRLWAEAVVGAASAERTPVVADRELPERSVALSIGYHRVLIGSLGTDARLHAVEGELRRHLNQAAIDWSWLGRAGDDLLLVMAGPPGSDTDENWKHACAVVERNERVCRTLVWLPPADPGNWPASLAPIVDRTFLVRPWHVKDPDGGGAGPLDPWARLAAELVNEDEGFDEAAARRWIEILSDPVDGGDLPERLVAALETAP